MPSLVSRDVQPPVLNDGALPCFVREPLTGCSEGTGGGGAEDAGGGGAETAAQPPPLEDDCVAPTEAQPVRFGGSGAAAGVVTVAHPLFLNPLAFVSLVPAASTGAGATTATGGFTILTPAAFAILRSSFSSRLRSFSFRLLTSSSVFLLARWAACISRKRTLWWCAYEFVCSSYWATFWNCFSHTSQ